MGSIFKSIFLAIFLSSCTSSIVFQPDKYLHNHPDNYKTKFDAFTILSTDKTKLSLWKLYSKEKNPKILVAFFHGNAENLTSHFANLVWMTDYKTDLYIFDYRGYGLSEGKPDMKGAVEDGKAFLEYTYNEYKKGKYEHFIIYTQSLGGYIALKGLEDFKDEKEISLLVLDSTFRSVREVAQDKTFWPLSLIISDKYSARPSLDHLKMPVLSIHSQQDPVINYELGEKLFRDIKTAPRKQMWSLKEEGHGSVFFVSGGTYRKAFIDYINDL